jgi:hypothetical protein
MGFVYEEEELELTFKGDVLKFRQPSAFEQKEMSKKFKNADENTDAVDLYIEFFKQLGLPEDVLGKMSLKGLLDLFGYVVGTKKN